MGACWVTRSEPGAGRLTSALGAAGYPVINAPVLSIEQRPPPPLAPRYALALVLSEQAVRLAPAALWARCDEVLAVGPRTALVLAEQGIAAGAPLDATSEGLLLGPLADRDWAGLRVALVRGGGGRELLRDALTAAGALVDDLAVYDRRAVLSLAELRLNQPAGAEPIEPGKIGAIIASSGDGLLAAARLALAALTVPVLVPSARVAQLAAEQGFSEVLECPGAGPDAVLQTLNANAVTGQLRRAV